MLFLCISDIHGHADALVRDGMTGGSRPLLAKFWKEFEDKRKAKEA